MACLIRKVAGTYKGRANVEARLIEHVTSGEEAKVSDGHERDHKVIKTSPPQGHGADHESRVVDIGAANEQFGD